MAAASGWAGWWQYAKISPHGITERKRAASCSWSVLLSYKLICVWAFSAPLRLQGMKRLPNSYPKTTNQRFYFRNIWRLFFPIIKWANLLIRLAVFFWDRKHGHPFLIIWIFSPQRNVLISSPQQQSKQSLINLSHLAMLANKPDNVKSDLLPCSFNSSASIWTGQSAALVSWQFIW